MKLKKFKTENKKKKAVIIGSIFFVFLISILVLYRSFAFFEENQAFNVIKGIVPNQNYDLMLALTKEDINQNKTIIHQVPEKNSEQKYEVEIDCNNDAIGIWNYENWNPEILNFTNNQTKCNINFKENNDFEYPIAENIENGKKAIANAITQKGINTSYEETLEKMALNIQNIKTTSNVSINGWPISIFGSVHNSTAQVSKTYLVTNGHYYILVLRLQSERSDSGWDGGDYVAANISLNGGTLIQKFTLGQGNINYAGLVFLIFKATSNTVNVNGIRFNKNSTGPRWYISDAIVDIYTY